MGLDINAYRKLEIVDNPKLDEDGDLENWETEWRPGDGMEWSEKHFPGRGEGIYPRKVYTWREKFRFRAGSYSGYNWWRSMLEEFKGDVAFQELIDFADNEGVIGFVVSRKLANDFAMHEVEAKEYSQKLGENAEFWLESYNNWKTAFEMAADYGAVEFR
ncbi:hypothetical protein [Bacillus sp. FJAT-22090]|uniref:hypothetical protein n=1 Tax=Bacillus sp. FJAT-22090 TaxID=1581038 RepID=UPI00119CE85C|nr:hypothetical protein [Bacillus sp. FJAT-22090]